MPEGCALDHASIGLRAGHAREEVCEEKVGQADGEVLDGVELLVAVPDFWVGALAGLENAYKRAINVADEIAKGAGRGLVRPGMLAKICLIPSNSEGSGQRTSFGFSLAMSL